jgi:hypothetical protein
MKQWGIIPWAILFSMFAFGLEPALWFWGGMLVLGIVVRIVVAVKQSQQD